MRTARETTLEVPEYVKLAWRRRNYLILIDSQWQH